MIWAVVIVGGLIFISAISSMSKKTEEAQKSAEYMELSKSKVDAYADYLRRTSSDEEIKAMTDNELREYLHTAIRNFNNDGKNMETIAGFIWVVLAGLGIILAFAREEWGPLVFFGIVATTIYLVTVWVSDKKREEKYRGKGFDPERLNIEQKG